MNNEQVKNFIIQQRQNGIPDAEIVSFLNSKGVNLQAQQEKSGSLVGNIIKDVGETLLVKPAARATEAATRLFAPNSVAARGYEAMADEGESQKILGIDVEAQKGVGGGRQIAGEALKTASYLFPYGKVAKGAGSLVGSKIAGNVASGVAGGYTADVGYNLTDEEKTVGESFVPGAGTIIGGAVPLVGPTVRGAGRLTKKTGEKIVDVVIPASKREAQILQTYRANNPFLKRIGDVLSNIDSSPTTAGKTVARTKAGQTIPGLFGTKSQIGVQAKRATKTLWEDVISPKLKESGQAVDLDGFFSKVQDDIIKNNPDLTRQKVLLKALQGIKNDYSGVNSISLEKLQKLKEGWAKPVPETAYSGKPISSAINDVRKQLSDEARGTIYDVLGDDVKQAYLDYGNLLGIQDMGVASMTGQKLKAGAGNFVSEVFSQAVTPIGTIAGQAIYRLGKGIEFVGNLGATNLGQALGVNLKFPGDAAIDDISKTVKKAKSLPNKQGGFIKLGQDIKAPMATAKELVKSAKKNLKDSPNAGFAEIYKGEKDLTTKILKDLEGKTTVSKQYILDATNRGELKQVERDLIREALATEKGDIINVANFAKKVKAELLPLKVNEKSKAQYARFTGYEETSLPKEIRGNVANYKENIYESPIKTSAGEKHYPGDTDNYFGHTRIEDMADNKTRRVIEVQSDLYQKGNLEGEANTIYKPKKMEEGRLGNVPAGGQEIDTVATAKRKQEVAKLQQYNDPTAHFRMIREEIKKAAQDGKTKLQFPTGETAMKIEGLGENNNWYVSGKGFGNYEKLTPDNLKVGATIETDAGQGLGTSGSDWIITDVLGDGKFKAVQAKDVYEGNPSFGNKSSVRELPDGRKYTNVGEETFDISGKVDTNNPIYKFYEKDVQKYLNKFGGKRVVDDKGVSWIEVPITKEQGKMPVEAFGKAQIGTVGKIGIGLGVLSGASQIKERLSKKPKK